MKKNIPPEEWRQISGDMDPGKHGAIIARFDGTAIDIREIQPTREYVGDAEAKDVGFPFWTNQAWYDFADLGSTDDPALRSALDSADINWGEIEAEQLPWVIAEVLIRFGYQSEPGPCGWGKDVLPDEPVHWWADEEPQGQDYFDSDDDEFRKEVLNESDERDSEV